MGSSLNSSPFWGFFLFIRVPYYFGDFEGDPNLENYAYRRLKNYLLLFRRVPEYRVPEYSCDPNVCSMLIEDRFWRFLQGARLIQGP